MTETTYPESDRRVIERIVSAPGFKDILTLPTLAWQEIVIIVACYTALATSSLLCAMGFLPYVLALLINVMAIYATFTPLHDATHRSVSSDPRINDWLGTIAALPLFPGFTTGLYRFLHLEHHRHTGEPGRDPDEFTVSAPTWLKPVALMFLDMYWLAWYARRAPHRPLREVFGAVGSAVFFLGWHAAWLLSPYTWEFVLLWLIPQRLGVTLLVYLFASIQHPEGVRQAERPFQSSRMFKGGWLARLLMISQSQHLMHHMFPAVPYYRYNQAWRVSAPLLRDRETVWDWPVGKLKHPGSGQASPTVLKARIAETAPVSSEIRSYLLESAGDNPFPAYTPGAHIDVRIAPGLTRQYSLVDAPRRDGRYRIAVKREDNGRGGSRTLHERFREGEIVPPRNNFPMAAADSVQLVAGGIGITPLIAMAEGTDFNLHVCARDRDALPFAQELATADYANQVRLHLDDSDPSQRLGRTDFPVWQPGLAMYLCGACACSFLDGEVDHRGVVLDEAARGDGRMTTCVSRAAGERLVLDL